MIQSQDQNQWPPRPNVFPEIMDTTTLAQFLAYDLRRTTIESARRNIRMKIKNAGLPALPKKIGGAYLFKRQAVMTWLELDNEMDNDHATDA